MKLGTNKFCLKKPYVYDGEQLKLINHVAKGHWQGHSDLSSIWFLSERNEIRIMPKTLLYMYLLWYQERWKLLFSWWHTPIHHRLFQRLCLFSHGVPAHKNCWMPLFSNTTIQRYTIIIIICFITTQWSCKWFSSSVHYLHKTEYETSVGKYCMLA